MFQVKACQPTARHVFAAIRGGHAQSIAVFGHPGAEKFELVITGRHLTLRCDGHSAEHVAFGGPIFHGHAAQDFHEKKDHPGNIFWPLAVEANKLYQMLDGRHRAEALIARGMPSEEKIAFRGRTFTSGSTSPTIRRSS